MGPDGPMHSWEDNGLSPVYAAAGRREARFPKLPGTPEGFPEISEPTCSFYTLLCHFHR